MTATAAHPVQRTTVDGIPVFWVDLPGPLHAELVFGVGRADETFRTTGITHLVEHLVMRRLGELDHTANAAVSLLLSGFEVTGEPQVVVDHLTRLCGAIRWPDLTEIDRERSVLVAEELAHPTSPLASLPLAQRYGNLGPGLAFCRQLGVHLVTSQDVRDWMARWLHRSNAALVLTGPPPPGLGLPLQDGPAPRRGLPRPLPGITPSWTELPIDGVLATMHGPDTAETATALSVLDDRLTRRLRHEAGLVYGIDVALEQLPGSVAIGLGLGLTGRAEHVPVLRDTFLSVLDELCVTGPTPAELERDRQRCRSEIADDRDIAWLRAYDEAAALLAGTVRSWDRVESTLAGLTREDVRAAAGTLRASMTLGVPEGAQPGSLPERRAAHRWPATGRLFRRSRFRSWMPRGSQLTMGRSALSLHVPGQPVTTIPYGEVVGMGTEPGPAGDDDRMVVVHGSDGEVIVVRAWDWRGGSAALDLLHAAVPSDAVFATPEPLRLLADDD